MDKEQLGTLSIAAPAYNEADCISEVVELWYHYLRREPTLDAFEIVVCNDGSTDDTGTILKKLASMYSEVKVVEHKENMGAAAALTTAINKTSFDWVFLLDADGQFPIDNLEFFRAAMEDLPSRAYIGVRSKKQDSVFARFGSWSSGALCNLFLGTNYRDFNSACKLINGEVLRWLHLEAKGLNYSTDITAKLIEANFAPIEVNIRHETRIGGKSNHSFIRDAVHRLMFVSYIIYRRLLISIGVLQSPSNLKNCPYD
jgi:glycosyltransferase involved in cell wall biosynthesis|tara:strand:+ start:528 stop:1298 length:771 start_codon:yes stop_codon:yes gene_type:complete